MRLITVAVRGPSMVPTCRDGDWLLAVVGGRATRPGDIVLARFRTRPDLLVVKRAHREESGGWWLQGDNPFVTDDSRAFGTADVQGRVVARYWPHPRLLRPSRSPSTHDQNG